MNPVKRSGTQNTEPTTEKVSLFLFLSFSHLKDDVEMKTFRKKLRSSNKQTRKKTQQRATQTNRRQCQQGERKKNSNTNASERKQLKYHTQKGRNGANRSHSCFVRTQLSFLFVLKAEKFSANTQNILVIFFFVSQVSIAFYLFVTDSFDLFLPCNFHTVTHHSYVQWPGEKSISSACDPEKAMYKCEIEEKKKIIRRKR